MGYYTDFSLTIVGSDDDIDMEKLVGVLNEETTYT